MSDNNKFKPFISPKESPKELTTTSVLLGIVLAVVFSGANAYLGLRVGMTISASIPAAVISMGVIRLLLKKESILENNMVQTIGSAGESVAAGTIFTMPTMFMWLAEAGENPPSFFEIMLISLCGGILGVLFMIPLRRALIVNEHADLPYPEGKACAEVLLAGEEKGSSAALVFKGLGISAIYKFITDGFKLFPSEIHYEGRTTGFGVDVLPALVSVGYICGYKISSYMLGGGIIAWLVIIPLLVFFGGNTVIFPSTSAMSELDSFSIWSSYIRYIGAGAVATGGIVSLIKTLPLIVNTFAGAIKSVRSNTATSTELRTERDLPIYIVFIGSVIVMLVIWLTPTIPVDFLGALVIAFFGFFFATVSSRLVGLVGSSNNPVSGMTIATLLIATVILKVTGSTGLVGMMGAISIGSIICIISAIAGDTSQDLKTGYILGATPASQQKGEFIGVIISSLTIGGVLYLLNSAWGYGSTQLPAPQATLMKLVVEGVMGGDLPWTLVLVGAGIAIAVEIIGIPVLPFCIGLYLPIHLSAGIMCGGIVRSYIEKRKASAEDKKTAVSNGVLYCSGMIAGEGLVGILLAFLAIIPFKSATLESFVDLSNNISLGAVGGLIIFALLIYSIIHASYKSK